MKIVIYLYLGFFLSSCSSNVEIVRHFVPVGYEGWLTIVYLDDNSINELNLKEHVYDNNGISFVEHGVIYNWRNDEFFYVNIDGNRDKVKIARGEMEMSGSRYIREYDSTFFYASGWVGKKPDSGREEHILKAIDLAIDQGQPPLNH